MRADDYRDMPRDPRAYFESRVVRHLPDPVRADLDPILWASFRAGMLFSAAFLMGSVPTGEEVAP